jgi:PAS domain S-box-containing protein
MSARGVEASLQELVERVSASFAALASDSLDGQLQETLGSVGKCLDLDLCILWQPASGVTHVWHSPSIPTPPQRLPWCAAELGEGRPLVVPSPALGLGVGSSLGLPLALGGGPVDAVLTFHSRREERPWPAEEIRNLERVGHAVANALARRRAEQVLHVRNVAGVGFYELRGGDQVSYLDEGLRSLLGLSRAQVVHPPVPWQEQVHEADRVRVSRLMQEAMEGRRESVATEYRYRHPRRGIVWLHHLFRVLERDEAGKGVKAIGAIQDVTARRQAVLALAKSERSFRATFEQAPVGVAHVGLDGAFLWVNTAFHEFLGLTRDAVLQSNLVDLARQVKLPADTAQLHQMLEGEIDSASGDRRYLRPSGEAVWGHVTVSVVRDRGGKPDWFVVIVQDVTARRKAEEELSRLHGQLWHADRAAQVGVLSASLAHELNQPLSAILTNAQAALRFLAMEAPDLEEIRTILEDIVQDDKRAGMVVSSLRAMLRRRGTQRESVRLADALHEVLGLLHTELLDRRVKVSTNADPDLVVLGDRTQLQQVMINLLMNAIEAVRDGPEEKRRIELTMLPVGRAQAQVAVRDHGAGISPEQQERMFEAFWTTKDTGMGIGLAISRSIVETHGGQLWYRNHPEGGATFHFTVPLVQ